MAPVLCDSSGCNVNTYLQHVAECDAIIVNGIDNLTFVPNRLVGMSMAVVQIQAKAVKLSSSAVTKLADAAKDVMAVFEGKQ
eukprot:1063228-Prorocentrum_minimum.AAC.1